MHQRAQDIVRRAEAALDDPELVADIALMCGMAVGYMLRALSAERRLKDLTHGDTQASTIT